MISPRIERACRALCKAEGYCDPDEDWAAAANGRPSAATPDIVLPDGERQRWRIYVTRIKAVLAALEPSEEIKHELSRELDLWDRRFDSPKTIVEALLQILEEG